MKHFCLFFFFILIFVVPIFSQSDEAFNDQIKKAEQALKERDVIKVKNILNSEPLKSRQDKKVKELNSKVYVVESIVNGYSHLKLKKWDDAIIEVDKGMTFYNKDKKLFTGSEKQELEKIKLDAENGKKGINVSDANTQSSSNTAVAAFELDNLGDPVDYETANSQMYKAYEDKKRSPFKEFEANKDSMERQNEIRQDRIGKDVINNLKSIDSALAKMQIERENTIQKIDSNRKEYINERDKVMNERNKQTNEVALYVKKSINDLDTAVTEINNTNNKRIKQINNSIDTMQKQTSHVKAEIQKENEKRIEVIGKNQKSTDSLNYQVRNSLNEATQKNADYVAENIKKMDEYRQSEPEKPKGGGIINPRTKEPYPVGITQGVFSKGEQGKPSVLITRRIKVDENNNYDIYIKQEAPNTLTSYTKNGVVVTEYQWNVESGNVTNFE